MEKNTQIILLASKCGKNKDYSSTYSFQEYGFWNLNDIAYDDTLSIP